MVRLIRADADSVGYRYPEVGIIPVPEIRSTLGHGHYSDVYRADFRGAQVALKVRSDGIISTSGLPE